jgi:hypothetical protein
VLLTGRIRDQKLASRLCYGPETKSLGAGCATNRTDQRPEAWEPVVLRTGRTRDQKLGSRLCHERDGPETRSLGAGCAPNRTDQGLNVQEHFATNEGNQRP